MVPSTYLKSTSSIPTNMRIDFHTTHLDIGILESKEIEALEGRHSQIDSQSSVARLDDSGATDLNKDDIVCARSCPSLAAAVSEATNQVEDNLVRCVRKVRAASANQIEERVMPRVGKAKVVSTNQAEDLMHIGTWSDGAEASNQGI